MSEPLSAPDDWARRFGGIGRLYGEAALARFRHAHVCVIGVGGVGSWAAEALARSGVAGLVLIDLDQVAESNINRQIQALGSTVGMAKAEALRQRIADIHPGCAVRVIEEFVEPDNWPALVGAAEFDGLIDCCDHVRAKATLAAWARELQLPFVTVGAAGGKREPHRVQIDDLADWPAADKRATVELVRARQADERQRLGGADQPVVLTLTGCASFSPDGAAHFGTPARATRTVFAPELPGFGLSDRSARAYTPRLMTDALHATLAQVRARCGTAPVDALAVSLGCEFLARAAVEQPAHFRRLALVSPTGFNGHTPRRGAPGSTRAVPGLHAVLSGGPWAQGLFSLLTRPGVVRFFLEKTWGGKAIDEPMFEYAVATAREPGARHAPLAFLGGGLFSADIHTVYESLTQPVWASHGVRGDFTDYRGLSFIAGRPNWRVSVFQTGAMPYFELPAEFGAAMDDFFAA